MPCIKRNYHLTYWFAQHLDDQLRRGSKLQAALGFAILPKHLRGRFLLFHSRSQVQATVYLDRFVSKAIHRLVRNDGVTNKICKMWTSDSTELATEMGLPLPRTKSRGSLGWRVAVASIAQPATVLDLTASTTASVGLLV